MISNPAHSADALRMLGADIQTIRRVISGLYNVQGAKHKQEYTADPGMQLMHGTSGRRRIIHANKAAERKHLFI